jgi:hypothetical protein
MASAATATFGAVARLPFLSGPARVTFWPPEASEDPAAGAAVTAGGR